jgi:hypothetical protein
MQGFYVATNTHMNRKGPVAVAVAVAVGAGMSVSWSHGGGYFLDVYEAGPTGGTSMRLLACGKYENEDVIGIG